MVVVHYTKGVNEHFKVTPEQKIVDGVTPVIWFSRKLPERHASLKFS
jgi:hypothetical protein